MPPPRRWRPGWPPWAPRPMVSSWPCSGTALWHKECHPGSYGCHWSGIKHLLLQWRHRTRPAGMPDVPVPATSFLLSSSLFTSCRQVPLHLRVLLHGGASPAAGPQERCGLEQSWPGEAYSGGTPHASAQPHTCRPCPSSLLMLQAWTTAPTMPAPCTTGRKIWRRQRGECGAGRESGAAPPLEQ